MGVSDAWEDHAEDWIRWARTPRHDGFWSGTWPELRAVLPQPDGLVVDLGCGEGRLARELEPLGHHVVGVDRSPTLVRAAAAAGPAIPVVQADCAQVPFRDRCASLVVACMVLLDVDDLDGTVREARRLLGDGGVLCVALTHPFSSAQDYTHFDSDAPVFHDPYLAQRRTEVRVERDGLEMTFVSMHRPLSTYVSALVAAGFVVTALREVGDEVIPWLRGLRAAARPPG